MTCVQRYQQLDSTYELDMDGDGCQDETEDVDDDGVFDVDDNCPTLQFQLDDYDGDLLGDV